MNTKEFSVRPVSDILLREKNWQVKVELRRHESYDMNRLDTL